MFVRLVKKPNQRVSVRIVESHRIEGKVRQKIVCGIGTAHEDETAKIESLKSIAEKLIISIKNESRPALPGFEEVAHKRRKGRNKKVAEISTTVAISDLQEQSRIHKGIDDVFGAVYDQLNLFDSINSGYKKQSTNEALKQIVLQRIANPTSKRKSVKDLDVDKGFEINLDKAYRVMDKAYANIERIKNRVATATKDFLSGSVDVAFFDVTTLYFESFNPDELRVSGYSKDAKFKETQVMLALITTTEGLPLGYELFRGNSYEGDTMITTIESIKSQYELSSVSVVADRAMFTKSNLEKLEEQGVLFIVAAKLKTLKKAAKEEILGDFEAAKASTSELETWTNEYDLDGRRLIVNYSSKRAEKDSFDRERLVERVSTKMKNGRVRLADLVTNSGTKKYLRIEKKGAKEAVLDTEKIERDKKWDGLHAVSTNHPINTLTSLAALEKYRGLWQIEDAFRVNKHDLKMRPIYHWTPTRIKAHVLLCFIAYSLVALARKKLKQKNLPISFAEARDQLKRVQTSIVVDTSTGQQFLLPSKLNQTQKQIYSAFGLKPLQTPIIL